MVVLVALLALYLGTGRHVARVAHGASWTHPVEARRLVRQCGHVNRADIYFVQGLGLEVVLVFDAVLMVWFTAADAEH